MTMSCTPMVTQTEGPGCGPGLGFTYELCNLRQATETPQGSRSLI